MVMQPYYSENGITIYHGDCREVLPILARVDHVITDPPYARDVYQRMRNPDSASGNGKISSTSTIAVMRKASPLTRPNVGQSRQSPRLEKLAAGDIGAIDEILELVAQQIARVTKRWALVFSDAETTGRWREALAGAGMRYVRTG